MGLKVRPQIEVTARYELRDDEGVLLDHSGDGEPLCYLHGTGRLLPALEDELEGAEAGDNLRVTLTPDQAFGHHRPELVFEAVQANLPEGVELEEGMTLTPGGQEGRFSLKVVALTEKGPCLMATIPTPAKP